MPPFRKSDAYSKYISALNNEGLYSAEGVVRHAQIYGLLPQDLDASELDDYCRAAAHAMAMRASRKLNCTPDGVDRTQPGSPRDAFLGIRWKTTISERFLSLDDREMVARFSSDEDYSGLMVVRRDRPRAFSWRHFAGMDAQLKARFKQRWPAFQLMAWVLLCACILLMFVSGFPAQSDPREEIRRLAREQNRERLWGLLKESRYQDFRPLILASIDHVEMSLGTPTPVILDMNELTAVFAFDEDPMLLFGHWRRRLGQRITVHNEHGYISEINRNGFILKTDRGYSREIPYPEIQAFGVSSWRVPPVTIYPRNNNAASILSSICWAMGWQMKSASSGMDPLLGSLAGSYDCQDYAAFLARVAPHLGISQAGNLVTFESMPDGILRSHIGFDFYFPYMETTVGDALEEYEILLQQSFILDTRKLKTKILYPPTQFNDFVAALNLKVRILSPNLVNIGDM